MSDHLISIILPVYNQADHIGIIVQEYEAALTKVRQPYELILVVNNCRDRSLEVCQALAEQSSTIRVVHSQKGGWGLAVKLGLQAAQGDILCYTNSARTSPEDLTLMLLYAVVYPNVVIKANRKIRDSLERRIGSLLYNLECRTLFDLSYWDINGTPKVFPRYFERLLKLQCNDDLIDAEFNVICRQENYPMLEVPIFSTKRHGGRSTTNYGSAFKMYVGAFRLWRRMRGARQ
ncbi:glycosyltransferase [Leptothermofonsia sichuanensis E412]|jgi:glycosyltransferase involved in cell wall biosynthesis|uniref:glycosyltransferase family 2 protein n=1 Tax=Leptothermofonsia sichuanensis TaxID=2917832 RepID=UPI001CA7019D|nr:glycosyltransferase [Leptothermofonsia sichuanensis]QZZ21434.1 glycosyltransferase [Leptothermofonsia sichuanensis E412]